MKKLLIGLTALALSGQTFAVEDDFDLCDQWSTLASSVMKSRQAEVSISKLINLAKGQKPIIEVVKMAYKRPAYSVEENQEREIKQFANEVYMICLEELDK